MSTLPAELTGTWAVDSAHSTVGFAVKHAMVSTTRGRFTAFTGGATIDAENPGNSSAWLDIEASSVDTGNERRDGHLQSPDFWDAANNPKITFRSNSAVLKSDDELVMTGDLTIKNVTKPVDITWTFGGVAKDPFGGGWKSGFEGVATVNREDWGLTWNAAVETGGFLISDKVKLVLEVEADKQDDKAA